MKDNMVKCPKCGNEQPENIEKCSYCGFRISSYTEYLNVEAKNVSYGYNKNFYEISPQWQRYVDKENGKSKKRFSIDPRYVIGFLIVAIALGSFIKYAIDSGMFKKDSSDSVNIGQGKSNTSVKQTDLSIKVTESNKNKLSVEAQNAYESAKDYLEFMAFSRKGLITQLTYEGYSRRCSRGGCLGAGHKRLAELWRKECKGDKGTSFPVSVLYVTQGKTGSLSYGSGIA